MKLTQLKRIVASAAAAGVLAATLIAPAGAQAAPSSHVQYTHKAYAKLSADFTAAGKTAVTADTYAFVAQVADLVNQERSKAGLKALAVDTNLQTMAQDKAVDMYKNNYFSHTSPTYGSPFDMMKTYKISYRAAGENIAKGQTSPAQVMNSWMNSPGHKANILSKNFTHIGVGYVNGIWVQEFIGK
ncbi:CAP domain-containing protein [Paenibacillus wulumuqiensis]|uniref:CAP domain-containing protein n=1 Tax=Paenibacillus wulumuqiensis TaxID=1567107 RepID=UPI000619FBB0|nr:CAP domain-containing protein [Paenibacillus wulumuqiensis]